MTDLELKYFKNNDLWKLFIQKGPDIKMGKYYILVHYENVKLYLIEKSIILILILNICFQIII
jgi:hypothetical protein